MTIALMEGVERWLNGTPLQSTSGKISPAMIVEGRPLPMTDRKRIAFGSYAMVYDGTNNTIQTSRTVRAIALRESNDAGGYYFMSIETGRRIHANKWVELPTTQREIDDVHNLVNKKNYSRVDDDILDIRYDSPTIENPADLYVTPSLDRIEDEVVHDNMDEKQTRDDVDQKDESVNNEEADNVSESNTLSDIDTESSSVYQEADVLDNIDSETIDSDDSSSSSIFDISSGTTIAPDDSTYVPSVDEASVHKVNASEVNSMDIILSISTMSAKRNYIKKVHLPVLP